MASLLLDQWRQADGWQLMGLGNLTSACDERVQKSFVVTALPGIQSAEIPASTIQYLSTKHLLQATSAEGFKANLTWGAWVAHWLNVCLLLSS